jgi:hypothetical protein
MIAEDLPSLADVLRGQRIEAVREEEDDRAGFTWLILTLDNGFEVMLPQEWSAVIVHPLRQ